MTTTETRSLSAFDYVKLHSGLKRKDAVYRLARKLDLYMTKNCIKGVTPELVKKVKGMSQNEVSSAPDKRFTGNVSSRG